MLVGAHLLLGLLMHLIANGAVELELIDPALARVLVSHRRRGKLDRSFDAMESLIAA
jgi:hypothetical protein